MNRLRMLLGIAFSISFLEAGEDPYLVTYSHQMEEPGNLEIATRSISGKPAAGNRFFASATEFEYGVKAWWTAELYLDGQSTRHESTVFTGFRWENRFRLLPREHWINPVFYVEFENINGADKSLLEIVGRDGQDELSIPNSESRVEKKREVEGKLILGSNVRGWNISENFIVEKDIRHAPFEFGYAIGISRPLALAARPERCSSCLENFRLGVEMYGGLGTHDRFGLRETSHYVAPTLSWTLADGSTTILFSPAFGITDTSAGVLLRLGVSYEINQMGRTFRQWLR